MCLRERVCVLEVVAGTYRGGEAADVWERSPDGRWGWGRWAQRAVITIRPHPGGLGGAAGAWHEASLSLGPPGPLPPEGQLQRERVCVEGVCLRVWSLCIAYKGVSHVSVCAAVSACDSVC